MDAQTAGPTDSPLIRQTIGDNLRATIAAHGDNEALVSVHQEVRWTYDEFGDRVDRLARGMLAAGLQRGDRVGMWSPNHAEWTLVQYATAAIGVVLVNVNPAYRTHELTFALTQSGCRWLIAAPTFRTSDYVAMVDEVRDDLPGLERAIFLWSDEWNTLAAGSDEISAADLDDVMASLDPDDPINIQYTSGTTGAPKGATLTHANILNNGWFVTELQSFTHEDRLCIPVPFYHCFGMVMGNLGCTTHGATMVIPGPSFDPEAVLAAVEQERCTALYGVPTMFIAELGAASFDDRDLSTLRTGCMAGSPCPVDVMTQVIERMHMGDVTIAYGMTETSPVSTQTRADDSLAQRTETVGRVHPHVEVRVADPVDGTILGRGEVGEFCTRGYSVMRGYWNDDERTAEAIDGDGWMHTGDLATMDDDGYVDIVGRIKDMVIRGGENVYPREVEEFLHGHPDIADVQVFGVPDERMGEELVAWIQVRDGADLDEAGVREFCRDRIAHFKVPRHVTFVDEFPMTVTGKAQKFKMRDRAMDALGLSD